MKRSGIAAQILLLFLGVALVYAYGALVGDESLVMFIGLASGFLAVAAAVLLFIWAAWKFLDASKDLIKGAVKAELDRRHPPSG